MVEHSGEGSNGCHSSNAELSNELGTLVSNCAKCKQTKADTYAL